MLENSNNSLGHLIAQLLRLNLNDHVWEEYEEALENIYGKIALQKAVNIIEQKEFLINRTLHTDYYNMLGLFDKLEAKKSILGK